MKFLPLELPQAIGFTLESWMSAQARHAKGNETANRGKGRKDTNQLAFVVAQKALGEIPKEDLGGKNPAAVTLGRLGGLKGGKARAEKLTPEERKAIAEKAAASRWKRS